MDVANGLPNVEQSYVEEMGICNERQAVALANEIDSIYKWHSFAEVIADGVLIAKSFLADKRILVKAYFREIYYPCQSPLDTAFLTAWPFSQVELVHY